MLGHTHFHTQIHTLLVCQLLIGFQHLHVHVKVMKSNQKLTNKQGVGRDVSLALLITYSLFSLLFYYY